MAHDLGRSFEAWLATLLSPSLYGQGGPEALNTDDGDSRDKAAVSALSLALIQRSAWKGNSPKSVCGMLHSIALGNGHTGGQDVVGREN